jgi:hypothetical protein
MGGLATTYGVESSMKPRSHFFLLDLSIVIKMIEMILPHAAGTTNSLTRNEKILNSPAKHTHEAQ